MDSLILWDVDGTILNSQRPTGKSLHCQALSNLGLPVNEPKFKTPGVTDSEILSQILEQEGIDYDLALLRDSLESLDRESKRIHPQSKFEICPGILEFFKSETARRFTHGILTGNTPKRTMSKLGAVDLVDTFNSNFLFTCGVGENRQQIAAKAKVGIDFRKFQSIIVIGDTPADIEVARTLNAYSVAVASGKYNLDELAKLKPDLTVSNFLENSHLIMNFLKLRLN